MKKMRVWFFCYLLVSILLLSSCASQQTNTVYPTKMHRKTKIAKKKKQLSSTSTRIQIIQSPDRLRVVLYSDACFQTNGDLIQVCAQQLGRAIKTMKHYSNGLIQVVSHTDDMYDPVTSEELTQRQANSVVAFLWSKGIAAPRLRAVGFGDHDPIASNKNVRACAANRRVEIVLVK